MGDFDGEQSERDKFFVVTFRDEPSRWFPVFFVFVALSPFFCAAVVLGYCLLLRFGIL